MSRLRPLAGLLTANGISTTGTRISTIAVPWFVLTTTGSASRTGLTALAEMTPLVVLQALGGPLADRLGVRRVALACDVLGAVAVAAIPLAHVAGLLDFPRLLVLVALVGATRGPGEAAHHALIPSVVAAAGQPTERVTGLAGAVDRGASTLGAAIAAGLIGLLGATGALVADAGSFAVSLVLLAITTRGLGGPVPRDPAEAEATYLADLRAGWRFMSHDAVLMGIGMMVAITNLLDQAFTSVLLPVWARDSGRGVAAVGLFGTTFGAAALLGSVLAAAYATRLPRYWTYLIAFCICGLPRFLVFALPAPLAAVIAVSVIAGFASGFLNPILGAVLFERIPAPMMGRVSAMNIAMSWSLIPFGGVLGGALVVAIGGGPALAVAGVGYFAATILPALQPRWREIDRRSSGASP